MNIPIYCENCKKDVTTEPIMMTARQEIVCSIECLVELENRGARKYDVA